MTASPLNFFYRIAQLLHGFALCGFHLIFGFRKHPRFRKHPPGSGLAGAGAELGIDGGVLNILVPEPVFGKVNVCPNPAQISRTASSVSSDHLRHKAIQTCISHRHSISDLLTTGQLPVSRNSGVRLSHSSSRCCRYSSNCWRFVELSGPRVG
jgi:hypothetical protein